MKNLLYLCFELPSWIFAGFFIGTGVVKYFNAPVWTLAVTIIIGITIGFVRLIVVLKPKK